jgi:Tol biopolymer transport system component
LSTRVRRSRQVWSRLLLATLAVALGSDAVEGQSPSLIQITSTPIPKRSSNPSINADGTRIAFHSDADLAPGMPGNAGGGQQIFLFDTTTGLFTQITNITSGGGGEPSINAAGTRIAFTSGADFTPGNPGNADHNAEIFLVDTTTGVFRQITNTTGTFKFNGLPSINADGTRIAFASNHDLTPGSPGNADGSTEIFLFDTTTGVLRQVTSGAERSINPSINAAGTRIAFESMSDLTRGNPGNADGNTEIFLFDTITGVTTQITNTQSPSTTFALNASPSIDAAGTRIAFISNRDLTPGRPGNTDNTLEVFLFDMTTGLITQVTSSAAVSLQPSISAAGTRIAFTSGGDLAPGNPGNADHNTEIFVYDIATGVTTQITNTTGNFFFVETVAINADGTRIAFAFQGDAAPPGNPDGNLEIFLAVLAASPGPATIPTLSVWMQLVLSGLLLLAGLRVIRRERQPRMRS